MESRAIPFRSSNGGYSLLGTESFMLSTGPRLAGKDYWKNKEVQFYLYPLLIVLSANASGKESES